ncbi:hypothetical protein C1H46_014272 [Malus baccata]|uniref:Uncharacterized protein n=1 Tax=Malus baccata TaxID=106549 RepID=A0A540MN41_MALBA|nr:hypothetical protein C1H46_014272 [Malus baccata]
MRSTRKEGFNVRSFWEERDWDEVDGGERLMGKSGLDLTLREVERRNGYVIDGAKFDGSERAGIWGGSFAALFVCNWS